MSRKHKLAWGLVTCLLCLQLSLLAGVSKDIENFYLQKYKNRALFLKIPVRGYRQGILVTSGGPQLDRSNAGEPLAFKVGDQVRITDINFKDDSIRFKIAAVDLSRDSELIFQFEGPLTQSFAQKAAFDRTLLQSLTEGISYKEIDSAKEDFIKLQFDQLIEQFAATTGKSPDFVVRTISEKNPEFQETKRKLARLQSELADAQQQAQGEVKSRKDAEAKVAGLTQKLTQNTASVDSLNEERIQLVDERDSLRAELQKAKTENEQFRKSRQEYEKQVNQMASNLNGKSDQNAELGKRVQSLNSAVEDLKNQKVGLAGKLESINRQVAELQKGSQELKDKLKASEEERKKQAAELKVLTSDKKSIQSRFLEMSRARDTLQTASKLTAALQLKRSSEGTPETEIYHVYLLTQKIGTLEVQIPRKIEASYLLRFSPESPDTVRFSEEERSLYQALGDNFRVTSSWVSSSPNLLVSLDQGEALKQVAPRESAEWSWRFDGTINQPVPVALQLGFKDARDQDISLPPQSYTVASGGAFSGFLARFSLWSLVAGLLVGSSAAALILLSRKPAASEKKLPEQREYVVQKKL